MRIRKGIVALVSAGLLAGVGAGSYIDIGGSAGAGEVACTVNNDDGIGGGGNRCGRRYGRGGGRKANKARKAGTRTSQKPSRGTWAKFA